MTSHSYVAYPTEARDPVAGPTVLYITNQLPFPAHSGGQVRESQLITRLGKKANIVLAVITEHFSRDVAHAVEALEHCSQVAIYESDPALERGVPTRVSRYRNEQFGQFLAAAASQVDLVHVEGYFLVRHLPPSLSAPLMLVAENVEFEIRYQDEGVSPPASSAMEIEAWQRAAAIGAMTSRDRDTISLLSGGTPVHVVSNGFDHIAGSRREHIHKGNGVVFVGNYQWAPTREGAERLLERIWPRLRGSHPTAVLQLVGAGLDNKLRALATSTEGVEVVGEVNSVAPYLTSADVFVCPIDNGSGTMIKMLKALRTGCAIVSTPHAVRGLPAGAGAAIRLAQTDDDFVAAIGELIDFPNERTALSSQAALVAHDFPSWDIAAEELLSFWMSGLDRGRRP